jgi:hypothetical protein
MLKNFFEEYNNLPVHKNDYYAFLRNNFNYYPLFWVIDSKYVLKKINGDIEEIDFYWKAILFSFLSKSIYRCSPENYHYCLDYLMFKHGVDIRFIFRNKMQLFVDVEFSKLDELSNLNTVKYSYDNLDKYISWLVELVCELNKKCCITDLPSRLLLGEKDNWFMEEFSKEESSLSNQFLNLFLKALKDVR